MGFPMKLLLRTAVLAALSLPTYAQAEVIELKCKIPGFTAASPLPLLVDTSSGRIKYAFWPWSSDSLFKDELILWTAILDSSEPSLGSFIFNRETGELSVRVFSPAQLQAELAPIQLYCVRPF